MGTMSDSEVRGKAYGEVETPAFLPMVARKIKARREELGEGQWLCEELKVALDEMAPVLERAQVTFEEGLERSIDYYRSVVN